MRTVLITVRFIYVLSSFCSTSIWLQLSTPIYCFFESSFPGSYNNISSNRFLLLFKSEHIIKYKYAYSLFVWLQIFGVSRGIRFPEKRKKRLWGEARFSSLINVTCAHYYFFFFSISAFYIIAVRGSVGVVLFAYNRFFPPIPFINGHWRNGKVFHFLRSATS